MLCHHWSGVEVEQAPFEPAIASCYMAILSVEHNLSQKFDLEAVAIASSELTRCLLNQTDRQMAVNYMTCMLN